MGYLLIVLLIGFNVFMVSRIYKVLLTTQPKKKGKKSSKGKKRGPRKGSAAWWAAHGVNTIEVRYDKNPDGSYSKKELINIAF